MHQDTLAQGSIEVSDGKHAMHAGNHSNGWNNNALISVRITGIVISYVQHHFVFTNILAAFAEERFAKPGAPLS